MLPSAREYIADCIGNPALTRIDLKLGKPADMIRLVPKRRGEELFTEATPRGSMRGLTETYPWADTSLMKIDLSAVSQGSSLKDINAHFGAYVRRMIDECGPFSLAPQEAAWKQGFLVAPDLNEHLMRITFVCAKGVPEWIVG